MESSATSSGMVPSSQPELDKRARKPNPNRVTVQSLVSDNSEQEREDTEGELHAAMPTPPAPKKKASTRNDPLDKIYTYMARQDVRNKAQVAMIEALQKEVVELRKTVSELRNVVVEKSDLQQANVEDLRTLVKPISQTSSGRANTYANAVRTPTTTIANLSSPLPTRDTHFRCVLDLTGASGTTTVGILGRESRKLCVCRREMSDGGFWPPWRIQ